MVRGLLKSRWHEMVFVMAGQMIDDDSYKCVPKGHYSIVFIWQGHAIQAATSKPIHFYYGTIIPVLDM
jgi:hypothetical protein